MFQQKLNTEANQDSTQTVNKLLLIEDADVVFADEADFYSQLIKLIGMTKVPIIITATCQSYLSKNLIPLLQKSNLHFETLQYNAK